MPLLEVIRGEQTSEATIAHALDVNLVALLDGDEHGPLAIEEGQVAGFSRVPTDVGHITDTHHAIGAGKHRDVLNLLKALIGTLGLDVEPPLASMDRTNRCIDPGITQSVGDLGW